MTKSYEELDRCIEQARTRRMLPPAPARRAIRVQACMTQHEFGEVVGTTRASISRYEDGSREPRGEIRERYALLLERLRLEVIAAP